MSSSSRSLSPARPHQSSGRPSSLARPSPALGDIWLQDWQAAGLLKTSAVKPVFATREQTLVIRQLGTLSRFDQTAVKNAVSLILG